MERKKNYIILTNSICFLGGGQKYVDNKIRRLKDKGFTIYVFSTAHGKIMIRDLSCYEKMISPELMFKPYIFSKRTIKKALDKFEKTLPKNESYYIESNSITLALWGELLAQRLAAKHICIDLEEEINYNNMDIFNYINFKVARQELYVIREKVVENILNGKDVSYNYLIKAEGNSNVVEDIPEDISEKFSQNSLNIGCISRYDKPFLIVALNDFIDFTLSNNNIKFNLILIGDGSLQIKTKIKEIVSRNRNVNLVMTGYLCPIPLKLLKKIDCFFSSSGSASVTSRLNIPTISITSSGRPVGILNYTTKETLYNTDNSNYSLKYYLNKILFESFCEEHHALKSVLPSFDWQKEFERQLAFFDDNQTNEYYIPQARGSNRLKYVFVNSFIQLFGMKGFLAAYSFICKLKA